MPDGSRVDRRTISSWGHLQIRHSHLSQLTVEGLIVVLNKMTHHQHFSTLCKPSFSAHATSIVRAIEPDYSVYSSMLAVRTVGALYAPALINSKGCRSTSMSCGADVSRDSGLNRYTSSPVYMEVYNETFLGGVFGTSYIARVRSLPGA